MIEICNYYDNSDTNNVAAADEDDSSADGACDSIEDVHDPRDNPAPSRFRVFQKLPSVLSERTKKLYEAKFKEDDRYCVLAWMVGLLIFIIVTELEVSIFKASHI